MLLIITILFPIIFGVLPSVLLKDRKKRNLLYILVLFVTAALSILSFFYGKSITVIRFFSNVTLNFTLDSLGKCFLIVVVLLYTLVSFYAFSYMEHEERPAVFFAFYFVSYGMMISLCMAGNPITMYLCFEMVTLSTVPLVLHELTKEAVAAGLKYLFYSVAGALMGLLTVFYLYFYAAGDAAFTLGGFLDKGLLSGNEGTLLIVLMIGLLGFGTKAGMYPMHGWLPAAHPIAPAPASALLSGIVAKAGVLAIIRIIFYSVGADFLQGTWVQTAWMCLAMLTIFMGSMMAFKEHVMKKRLAYSTVSQISYILLSLSFLSTESFKGGLLHFYSHAVSKGCLFLVAGVFIHQLGIREVKDLKGIGSRMPITMICFTLASLSLVGIPPMGGFLSKWSIASAALDSGLTPFNILAPVVLLISALLTAGYLFPITVDAFFPGKGESEPATASNDTDSENTPAIQEGGSPEASSGEKLSEGDSLEALPLEKLSDGDSFKALPLEKLSAGDSDRSASESSMDDLTLKEPAKALSDAEPSPLMTVPMAILCAAALIVGLFGGTIMEVFF